jgi:tRNA acetyltransferase TAN1
VDPVGLVNKICDDALANPSLKRTRFAKRLSPMTLMGRASVEGLEKVAKEVLEPHFHQTPFQKRKVSGFRPLFEAMWEVE